MTPVRLFLVLIIATGIGAVPKLFSKGMQHKHHASKGTSKHQLLKGVKDSLGNKKHASGSSLFNSKNKIHGNKHASGKYHKGPKGLRGDLEALYAHAEFLIEGVGQILVATDNINVEDTMLKELDDRLVLLYKYYEDDIEELLNYLKQVTDTTQMKTYKKKYDLDEEEEFIITGGVAVPDPDVVGDWGTSSATVWKWEA